MQRVAARPGDWKCPSRLCQAHNFASKTKCFKCGNSKPGSRGGAGGREGDWVCKACQGNNFSNKVACFKCGLQKPEDVTPTPGAATSDAPKRDRRKKKKRQQFENTGVYFENLPRGQLLFDVQQIVRELCLPFGTMRKVNAYRSKEDENLSQGDALAVFSSAEQADTACAQLQNHPIYKVSRATFQPKAKKAPPANGEGSVAAARSSSTGAAGSVPTPTPSGATAGGAGGSVASAVPLAVKPSSTSDTVFIADVFDPLAETSKDEAELKLKCAAFGEIAKWYIDDDGNVLVQFKDPAVAFQCADALHASHFMGKSLVCDFVESVKRPRPVTGRCVTITNAFHAQQAAVDPRFAPQLRVDFKAACSAYGPVKEVEVIFGGDATPEVRVRFPSGLCASDCRRGMHGRPFDGRALCAEVVQEAGPYDAESSSSSSDEEEEEEEEKEQEADGNSPALQGEE